MPWWSKCFWSKEEGVVVVKLAFVLALSTQCEIYCCFILLLTSLLKHRKLRWFQGLICTKDSLHPLHTGRRQLRSGLVLRCRDAATPVSDETLPRVQTFKLTSGTPSNIAHRDAIVPCERYCHKEYTCTIWKTLSLLVWKLWARLEFFKNRENFTVKSYGTVCKILSQGIHMYNMKALSLLVWKLCPRLKFLFTHTRWRRC